MADTTTITRRKELRRDDELLDANAPCTAELAECQCPDFCERDHGNE